VKHQPALAHHFQKNSTHALGKDPRLYLYNSAIYLYDQHRGPPVATSILTPHWGPVSYEDVGFARVLRVARRGRRAPAALEEAQDPLAQRRLLLALREGRVELAHVV
jgi:hypothetical protein